MKTLKELAKQETFSRNDLLIIFDNLQYLLNQSGCSRLWDTQEALGFDRNEEPKEE